MTAALNPTDATRTGSIVLDRSDRVRLDVSGPDRAKFLHNLTTNDVKRLAVGHGIEAFVTSPQGKTLGHVTVLAADDRLMVRTDPGGASKVMPHLEKYGIFDDVALDDVSARTFEFHCAGSGIDEDFRKIGVDPPEPVALRHVAATIGNAPVRVVREDPLGLPGLTVIGTRGDAEAVRAALALGVLDPREAEAMRIEAGTPVFGRDVNFENLPQEVGRDDRAINFVKGCYLGQETVARIDALGHVNKRLRGLLIEGEAADVPAVGGPIEGDGKAVGAVTSAAFSKGRGTIVALGYVRTSHAEAGTPVDIVSGGKRLSAVVTDLPIPWGA